MVRIRLRRVGAKKQPSYRVVVADSRSPRDGRFIEIIGHYNPRTNPPTVALKEDRALYWLSVGAQPSEPVARFFQQLGLYERLRQSRGGVVEPAPEADTVEAAPARRSAAAKPEPAPEPEPAVESEPEAVEEPVAEVADEVGAEVESDVEGEAGPGGQIGPDAAVADLGLPTRVTNVLEGAGIETAGDLADRLTSGELADVAGIGPKAVDEIRTRLAEQGLVEE